MCSGFALRYWLHILLYSSEAGSIHLHMKQCIYYLVFIVKVNCKSKRFSFFFCYFTDDVENHVPFYT